MVEKTTEEKKAYHQKWREDNRDKSRAADKKFRESQKRKDYLKEYRKTEAAKDYKKKWEDNNVEKRREYSRNYGRSEKGKIRFKRYYKTDKGILNMLRKHDAKRLKVKSPEFTLEVIQMIKERDKECVYCGKEFDGDIDHDHINPFLPFSKYNIVRCCSECNKDKSRANMIEWINFKGYKISQKLLDLYKKAYS